MHHDPGCYLAGLRLLQATLGMQVHPAGADAAIHAGAALRKQEDKGMMASVAVGLYSAQEALEGKRTYPMPDWLSRFPP